MTLSNVLILLSLCVTVLGGAGGVLWRFSGRITSLERGQESHAEKIARLEGEVEKQDTRSDKIAESVTKIEVQSAHILERIESLFLLVKQQRS